jgi:hypothetical protein
MYEPRTLEEAKAIILNLRNRERKFFREMCIAKARVYDLMLQGKPEPSMMELKERNIFLQNELNHARRERDEARSRILESKI